MGNGAQQRPTNKKTFGVQLVFRRIDGTVRLAGPHIGPRAVDISISNFGGAQVQQLTGVVPFVDRLSHVDTFVALQAQQFPARPPRKHLRHFSLSHACFSFKQQRPTQRHRQEDHRGQALIGEVPVAAKSGHHLVDGSR